MENQKTIRVCGSAIITAAGEVFLAPCRKLEASEKPQKTVAACKIIAEELYLKPLGNCKL
jgi:hypothetical protein